MRLGTNRALIVSRVADVPHDISRCGILPPDALPATTTVPAVAENSDPSVRMQLSAVRATDTVVVGMYEEGKAAPASN